MIRLLALVPVLFLLASPALAGDGSGVHLRLELGHATSAELRARVTLPPSACPGPFWAPEGIPKKISEWNRECEGALLPPL